MLSGLRSLTMSIQSAPSLPRIPELEAVYRMGVKPSQGEFIMVAGRSGSQKSGFAIWLCQKWNLPTLYFSGDMSGYQASVRLACSILGLTTDEVEERLAAGGRRAAEVSAALAECNVDFSFGPIRWRNVEAELDAYVEMHNAFPKLLVIDNAMDVEGAESDYQEQMAVMQDLSELSRMTGATLLVLHHATDKSWDAKSDPWRPPSRDQIKGGLAEKPELILTVAIDPTSHDFNVACVKQRMGPSNATGGTYATLAARPAMTRFEKARERYRPPTAVTEFSVG